MIPLAALFRRVVVLATLLLVFPRALAAQLLSAEPNRTDEDAITLEAYIYAYPMIAMEMARRAQTNVGPGAPTLAVAPLMGQAPMNQFAHQRAFPDAATMTLQRPSVDVLTSTLWFDVGKEPLVVDVPDAGGRYYVLAMLDLWTDVFASMGPRTSGRGAQTYALTARDWTGTLPDGVTRIEAPTNVGMLLARVATDGTGDYAAVHGFQDGLRAAPLGQWRKDAAATPPAGTYDAAVDMRSPWEQIPRLPAENFFKLFAELTKANPPHPNDWPIRQRMARIGIVPGTTLAIASLESEVRTALPSLPTTAGQTLFEALKRAGTRWNGWRTLQTPMGTYGTDYQRRQVLAFSALGAALPEDLTYFFTIADGEGKPLESKNRYTLHFDAHHLPPVNAFWSVTAYDERQLLPATSAKRFAVSDRDRLAMNDDGSLDVVIQRDPPAGDKDANWLPTPRDGRFSLTLRLWWPKPAGLDGAWQPPPLTIVRAPPAVPTP